MKASLNHEHKASYLDVTEFILKECSPLIKAASPKISFYEQFFSNCFCAIDSMTEMLKKNPRYRYQKTPEINPIDHDPSKFEMTPLCTGLCGPQILQIMDEFALECGNEGYVMEGKYEPRSKHNKVKQSKQRNSCLIEILQDEEILKMIPELENEDQLQVFYEVYNEEELDYDEDEDMVYSDYSDDLMSSSKDFYLEKHSTFDDPCLEFNQTIERFRENPKKEIIKQMRQIQNTMPEETDESKKAMIKKLIEKYLLDYEIYCYEESWKELEEYDLNVMIKKIVEGLNETFGKRIGNLPFQVRRTKILKYLQKKKKRIWKKKVSYDCRKKVADGRLRIKGKFVTREQACETLGVQTLQGYTADQIKFMLERRMDSKDYSS